MTRARLTVSTMLGLIALSAVALAALRNASPAWGVAVFVAEWVVLLGCVLRLWFARGPARAPWIGALILGGGALLATSPNLLLTQPPGNQLGVVFGEIYEQLHPRPPQQYIPQTLDPAETFRRQVDNNLAHNAYYTRQNRFTAIATSLLVIGFAILGGFAGRAAGARNDAGVPAAGAGGYTGGKEGP